eukprot:350208-Chlamydomonas_euryale.AAC.8
MSALPAELALMIGSCLSAVVGPHSPRNVVGIVSWKGVQATCARADAVLPTLPSSQVFWAERESNACGQPVYSARMSTAASPHAGMSFPTGERAYCPNPYRRQQHCRPFLPLMLLLAISYHH